ncbi:MAG: hypothetical protein ABFR65_09040, partial [Pseudomonadota bacterium]
MASAILALPIIASETSKIARHYVATAHDPQGDSGENFPLTLIEGGHTHGGITRRKRIGGKAGRAG